MIRAKDTPNFIANRIGIFSVLATMQHAEAFGLGFDVVDALTGPAIGRAKSATYRTADVVGLDTMAHVVKTMFDTLPTTRGMRSSPRPPVLAGLVAQGALGAKTKAGSSARSARKSRCSIRRRATIAPRRRGRAGSRRACSRSVSGRKVRRSCALARIRRRNSCGRSSATCSTTARTTWPMIADNARDVDLAIRWGFGWQMGPFETWQAAGWKQIAAWMAEDIAAGKTLSKAPLPAWVTGAKSPRARRARGAGRVFGGA